LVPLTLRSFNGSRLEIDRDHLAHLYIHVGVALEDVAQGKRRIARRQHGGGHLVEQRLELLKIVLVDQRDPNIRMRSQLTGTVQSGETATDDNYVLHAVRLLFDGLGHGYSIFTSGRSVQVGTDSHNWEIW
jgi:hypothetical protein